MTINLTELRDEPLGKPHSMELFTVYPLCSCHIQAQQDVVAADDESSFTFDVEGLGDEALDDSPSVECFIYLPCYGGPLSDEALDDSPSVSAFPCLPSNYCGLSDEALDHDAPGSPGLHAFTGLPSCVQYCLGISDEPLDAPYKRTALVCLNVLCGAGTSPWG